MYVIQFIRGFCMALADSVPGVSGGTIAFLMGFYDNFITSIDDLLTGNMEKKKKAFMFLVKLGIGWVIGFLSAVLVLTSVFESHIYAFGPHGFSTCDSSIQYRETKMCSRISNWVTDSIGWLKDMFGDFGNGGMTEPACKPHFTGDDDPYLSVDCTIGHLLKNEKAREAMGDILAQFETNEEMLEAVSRMQIKGVLGFFRIPKEEIEDLDAKLKKIENV